MSSIPRFRVRIDSGVSQSNCTWRRWQKDMNPPDGMRLQMHKRPVLGARDVSSRRILPGVRRLFILLVVCATMQLLGWPVHTFSAFTPHFGVRGTLLEAHIRPCDTTSTLRRSRDKMVAGFCGRDCSFLGPMWCCRDVFTSSFFEAKTVDMKSVNERSLARRIHQGSHGESHGVEVQDSK
jgi:hypothetical protein